MVANQVQQRRHPAKPAPQPVNTGLVLASTDLRPEVEILLAKFSFKDPNLIPAGITRVDREPDYRMDVAHQLAAYRTSRPELGKTGRVREGRVDTGTQVVTTRRPIHAAILRRGLTNVGFSLTHLHWFSKESNPKDTRQASDPIYVVVASFARGSRDAAPTTKEVEALRALARVTWGSCYVWDNPQLNPEDAVVSTINFTGGPLKDQDAKQAIAVRDGKIIAVDTKVEEAEE